MVLYHYKLLPLLLETDSDDNFSPVLYFAMPLFIIFPLYFPLIPCYHHHHKPLTTTFH